MEAALMEDEPRLHPNKSSSAQKTNPKNFFICILKLSQAVVKSTRESTVKNIVLCLQRFSFCPSNENVRRTQFPRQINCGGRSRWLREIHANLSAQTMA